jgi:hypothetical protein
VGIEKPTASAEWDSLGGRLHIKDAQNGCIKRYDTVIREVDGASILGAIILMSNATQKPKL